MIEIGYIVASSQVANDENPVGYMYREEPDNPNDSGWRVFSGEESQDYADNPENFAMYNASTIIRIDPSITSLLSAPAPVAYERDAAGQLVKVSAD